ncbi:MAG TPA: hypothetical protein VMN03_01710 [Burkholderiales bacterium]|nr:hypothetical protein [Burkholderiales bacterium]
MNADRLKKQELRLPGFISTFIQFLFSRFSPPPKCPGTPEKSGLPGRLQFGVHRRLNSASLAQPQGAGLTYIKPGRIERSRL